MLNFLVMLQAKGWMNNLAENPESSLDSSSTHPLMLSVQRSLNIFKWKNRIVIFLEIGWWKTVDFWPRIWRGDLSKTQCGRTWKDKSIRKESSDTDRKASDVFLCLKQWFSFSTSLVQAGNPRGGPPSGLIMACVCVPQANGPIVGDGQSTLVEEVPGLWV